MADPRPNAPSNPQKFVRTFATDSAAVQAGHTPDFEERESIEPALPRMSIGDAIAADAARVAPMNLDTIDHGTIEQLRPRVVAPAPTPIPAPPPLPPITPAPPPPPAPEATPIHTYKSDFTDEVRETGASQANIIAAQLDATPPAPARAKRSVDWMIIVSFLLIIIGIGSAGGAYYYREMHPLTVAAPITPSAPIFVDEYKEISGNGTALAQAIAASVATPPADNAVRMLYTADSAATTSVFNALGLSAPDLVLRNITPQGSMAGVVNTDGSASPFFILAVSSYSDTFSGMLRWESALPSALALLYPTPLTASSTATSTQQKTASSTPPSFRDETVSNHAARALMDSSGTTYIIYGYFNQQTLVIAKNESAWSAIIGRLTNSQTQS